ncbi:hypothetical protein PHET_03467 [Paragonimus heterotremus]|uniref:Transmembrane protein 185B n=1 Tax=Paragonimus heterotremus TaxID=100268 RepID=A0A8J4SNW5_9TREM|nr:hypothetical protein PHET_03467 [Paragonimus heterotremus]
MAILTHAFFLLLGAMALDGLIDWPVWTIFLPLWVCAIVGWLDCVLGLACVCYRYEASGHFTRSCTYIQRFLYLLCLFMFEDFVCIRLQDQSMKWVWIFIPVYCVCGLGIFKWRIAEIDGQLCDIELFLSANIITFILIALRLDDWMDWTWTIVLMPLWIILGVSALAVFYGLISALLLFNARGVDLQGRNQIVLTSAFYSVAVVFLIIFFSFLTDKLDGARSVTYVSLFMLCCPTLASLMVLTIWHNRPGEHWFGIRKSLCCVPLTSAKNEYISSSALTKSCQVPIQSGHPDTRPTDNQATHTEGATTGATSNEIVEDPRTFASRGDPYITNELNSRNNDHIELSLQEVRQPK